MPANSEDARQGTEKQNAAPKQVRLRSRSPPLPDGHSNQKKEIEHIVANRLQPASEIRFQQFQPRDFAIASVQDTGEETQQCAKHRVPVTTKREECRRHNSD